MLPESRNNRIVKYACYATNLSMAIVGNLSPILFLTFHSMYDISFSMLGLLILINFITQLSIDLIFSFFSHKFNIHKAVKIAPVITVIGLILYSVLPGLLPQIPYLGLALGTVVFSMSSGLIEVLISPVIAALPAKDPDKEMSKLHSVYAWGVVFMIVFSTLFLYIFGKENWQWLAIIFALIPTASAILFTQAKLPAMETPERVTDVLCWLKDKYLWLSVLAIFLGGACEVNMAQWSSGYLEQAFGIPKVYGDIFGVALFSVMLGLGRTLYAKIGKNIEKVILLGAIGAAVCYLITAVTSVPILALIACAFTGFCVAMMWPGNLMVIARRFPAGGVFVYALMAAGGDLGCSVVPQLVGVITDSVIANPSMMQVAANLQLSAEQLGMKVSMLCALVVPVGAIIVQSIILHTRKNFPEKD